MKTANPALVTGIQNKIISLIGLTSYCVQSAAWKKLGMPPFQTNILTNELNLINHNLEASVLYLFVTLPGFPQSYGVSICTMPCKIDPAIPVDHPTKLSMLPLRYSDSGITQSWMFDTFKESMVVAGHLSSHRISHPEQKDIQEGLASSKGIPINDAWRKFISSHTLTTNMLKEGEYTDAVQHFRYSSILKEIISVACDRYADSGERSGVMESHARRFCAELEKDMHHEACSSINRLNPNLSRHRQRRLLKLSRDYTNFRPPNNRWDLVWDMDDPKDPATIAATPATTPAPAQDNELEIAVHPLEIAVHPLGIDDGEGEEEESIFQENTRSGNTI